MIFVRVFSNDQHLDFTMELPETDPDHGILIHSQPEAGGRVVHMKYAVVPVHMKYARPDPKKRHPAAGRARGLGQGWV